MTYVGDCIFIKNLSPHTLHAFVSRDNGGSDLWHTLTASFKSGRWGRSGWEVVVLRDERDTWRTGTYMHIKDATVYITVLDLHDIRVAYARERCAAPRAVSTPVPMPMPMPQFPKISRCGHMYSQPYIGDCVLIRNAFGKRVQAFVSSYQGGGNGWYTLTKSFADGRWNRRGWEVVVCRDAEDTWRKGVYVNLTGVTVYVTVSGAGEIEIEYGGDEVGINSGSDGDGGVFGGEGGRREITEARLASLGGTCRKRDDEAETLYDEYQPWRPLGPCLTTTGRIERRIRRRIDLNQSLVSSLLTE
ncbi:hypothetical protein AB1N83_013109 [Pleurotus pulmonarius]